MLEMSDNLFTVNVIEMSSDDILQLVAFPETPEGNENAEKLFRTIVLESYPDTRPDDLDSYIRDGLFHREGLFHTKFIKYQGHWSVLLVHSS
jgi:hypothetical protein